MPRYNKFNYSNSWSTDKIVKDAKYASKKRVGGHVFSRLFQIDQQWLKFDKFCQNVLKYLEYVKYDGFTSSSGWSENFLYEKSFNEYEQINDGRVAYSYREEIYETHKTPDDKLAVISFSLKKKNMYNKDEAHEPLDPPLLPPLIHEDDIPSMLVPDIEYYAEFELKESDRETDKRDRILLWELVEEINQRIGEKRNFFEEIRETYKRDYFIDKQNIKLSSEKFLLMGFKRSNNLLPRFYQFDYQASYLQDEKIVIVQFKFPDLSNISFIKEIKTLKNYKLKASYFSEIQKKKISKTILNSFLIRTAKLVSIFMDKNLLDSIVVNIEQDWIDPATGNKRNGIIASLQSSYEEIIDLNLSNLDPDICVRNLKGIITPSMDKIVPIQPMMIMDKNNNKFVDTKNIEELGLTDENLATMPWEDFEHLVGQIVEWEFKESGMEVKVTQASRDKGVDAVLIDPDPIKGGLYIIQAKRYTNTVDVSAVRDLHGTIIDQGANKGILITTSSFGSESYTYIKDKPISLVDGSNLLKLLEKHGRKYKIDLAAAKIINRDSKNL